MLSTLQAFSHVVYSSHSSVGRQNYPTITDEETKVLRLHFLPQITQLVRGRSELDPSLCPKSLCSPSHSAASLPPTVQGSHSGHSTNTGHCHSISTVSIILSQASPLLTHSVRRCCHFAGDPIYDRHIPSSVNSSG